MNSLDNEESDNPSPTLINTNELCCIKCPGEKSQYEDLTIVKKGMQKILDYSTKINDLALTEYLIEMQTTNGVVKIHRECQKEIYNELKRKSTLLKLFNQKSLKLKQDVQLVILLIGKNNVSYVQNHALQIKNIQIVPTSTKWQRCLLEILAFCTKRNDEWGMEVQRRTLNCHDFVAAEARYHKLCYCRF